MTFTPPASFVKNSLSGHSWIGLLVGALMYIVCLSGTVAVFFNELERWEQPHVGEYTDYDPAAIEKAFHAMTNSGTAITEHLFVSMPTAEMPRATVATEKEGWFVNPDGSLGETVAHDWTHMLIYLHLFLHLPEDFGMVVVSLLGAMLVGLIVSGFLAHPRIFKDAFCLRLKGSRHLEQADLHNRLSVWGTPFHLMIAVTGAYFGLVALMGLVIAAAFFDGDRDAARSYIFGDEPELHTEQVEPLAIGRVIRDVKARDPHGQPFYITVHNAGTPEQHIDVGARHPDRLIWAERHQFDAAGNYLGKAGFSDGEPGRQAIFSVYRLHFGHFGGLPVKFAYLVFGLALTVVSATGVNVWLARRKRRDYLNNVWTGLVWGTPPALALTAIAQVIFHVPSTLLFWAGLAAAVVLAQKLDNDARGKQILQAIAAALLGVLVAGHAIKYGEHAFAAAALGVNVSLLITALIFGYMAMRRKRKLPGRETSTEGEYSMEHIGN